MLKSKARRGPKKAAAQAPAKGLAPSSRPRELRADPCSPAPPAKRRHYQGPSPTSLASRSSAKDSSLLPHIPDAAAAAAASGELHGLDDKLHDGHDGMERTGSHSGLDDIQLDLNNLADGDDALMDHVQDAVTQARAQDFELRRHSHHGPGALIPPHPARGAGGTAASPLLEPKAHWTPERIAELRELVTSHGQANLSRQSSNFWSEVTSASKTLGAFTKEAVRMKARRLGLLSACDGLGSMAPAAMPQPQHGRSRVRMPVLPDGSAQPPVEARLDVLDVLAARGADLEQLQAISAKRGGDPVALRAWLTTVLGNLRREVEQSAPRCSGGGAGKWMPDQESELRALLACETNCAPGGLAKQKPSFWQGLARGSRLLQGFSAEALRGKAKRMGIQMRDCGAAGVPGVAAATSTGKKPDPGVAIDGHGKGRWSAEQMAELRALVLAKRQHLGAAVVHERGFWLEVRTSSSTLQGFSNESLRMKARRMHLLDGAGDTGSPRAPGAAGAQLGLGGLECGPPQPEEPAEARRGPAALGTEGREHQHKRGWSEENMAELRGLLVSQWEAGVSQGINGFWEGIIRSSSTLHNFKPDSVRKKAKAMGEKGQLPDELMNSSKRRVGENGRPVRQMPLNPAQIKELQQLLFARRQGAGLFPTNGDDGHGFWASLQRDSRTLKNFSLEVIKAKAEKLQQQGALSVAAEALLGSHDGHGGEMLPLSTSSSGLHQAAGDDDIDAMAVAWGHINAAAAEDISSPVVALSTEDVQ